MCYDTDEWEDNEVDDWNGDNGVEKPTHIYTHPRTHTNAHARTHTYI